MIQSKNQVQLVCPACRTAEITAETDGVLDAQYRCQRCHKQWPVQGNLPILLRRFEALRGRRGEPSHADAQTLLQTWAPAHWGALAGLPQGQMPWLAKWLPGEHELPPGPVLVLGCGAGAELARLHLPKREIWALDAAMVLLEWLQKALENQKFMLPTPQGLVQAHWPVKIHQRLKRVHWLVGDAHDPPFAGEQFACVIALNLLDAVARPLLVLQQCEALLAPGGLLLLTTPHQWQENVTPLDEQLPNLWPHLPDREGLIRLATGQILPQVGADLLLEREADGLGWTLPLGNRRSVRYEVQALRLRKV